MIINATEIMITARGSLEIGKQLRKTEKAQHREYLRGYKNPTLFRFYRAMDAYEKLEKINARREILDDAKSNLYSAFGKNLPLIEEKASKISVGGVALGVWSLVGGHKTLSETISAFKEKIFGMKSEDAPKSGPASQ